MTTDPVEEITLGGPYFKLYENGKPFALVNNAEWEYKNARNEEIEEYDYTLYHPKSKFAAHLYVEFVGFPQYRQFVEMDKKLRRHLDFEEEDCMMLDMANIRPGMDFLREEECA